MTLKYKELTGQIIGAGIEVHQQLGPGFLESFYENAMSIELQHQGIEFKRQVAVPVLYRGVEVGSHRLDLLVADLIVVELKAIKQLDDIHFAIVRSYLHAINREHGLILNFARRTLQTKRVLAHQST